jgi:catalase
MIYAVVAVEPPVALPDGIAASEDPVLRARPGAYAISFGQRLK